MKLFFIACAALCIAISTAFAPLTPVGRTVSKPLALDLGKMFEKMTDGRQARASHILIKGPDGEAKLEVLKGKIGDNANKFMNTAQQFSECPSAKNGGQLGKFKRGMMVAEFDDCVFSEEVGKVHGPVKTQFGHHLILIEERDEK
ncbi:unnamed protein product [Chrysoparadoxa australica]